MALVEEVLVVVLYLGLGFVLGGREGGDRERGEIEGRAWKGRGERGPGGGVGRKSRRRGGRRREGGVIGVVLGEVVRAHERERR